MANRVVVGGAAGVGLWYFMNERRKDYLCQKEAEEAEQRRLDQIEQQERREYESRLRKQHRQDEEDDESDVICTILEAVDEEIKFLLTDIYNEQKRKQRESSRSAAESVQLPLLGMNDANGEVATPSQIVLGAAFAIGKPEAIQTVLLQLLNNKRPSGMFLTDLSRASMRTIGQSFSTYCDRVPVHYSLPNISLSSFLQSSHHSKDLAFLASLTAFSIPDDEQQKKPFCRRMACSSFYTPQRIQALMRLGRELGLYILQRDHFRENVVGDTHVYFRLKNRSNNALRVKHNVKCHTLFVMNFYGSFSVALEPSDPGTLKLDFSRCTLLNGLHTKVEEVRQYEAQMFASRLVAVSTMIEANRRLHKLYLAEDIETTRFSYEHIYVSSGGCERGHVLHDLQQSDQSLIELHRDKISEAISKKLLQSIPCPNQDLRISKPSSLEPPSQALKEEVSAFCHHYIELLQLSHCVVPRLQGRPPSQHVPDSSVVQVGRKTLIQGLPFLQRRLQRYFELDERSRLIESRQLCAPSASWTVACVGLILITMYWVCYVPIAAISVPWLSPWAHAVSTLFTAWTVRPFFRLLEKPLLVEADKEERFFLERTWTTASNLTESITRRLTELRGMPNSFEHHLQHVRQICSAKHHEWCLRLAIRNYYAALARKRISYNACEGLLIDLCDLEQDMSTVTATGTLPGTREDAEAFLRLEMAKDEENDEPLPSIDTCFTDLKTDIESLMIQPFFDIGARVTVDLGAGELTGAEGQHSASVVAPCDENGNVGVLLDGTNLPVSIPLERCTELRETFLELKKTSSSQPHDATIAYLHDSTESMNENAEKKDENFESEGGVKRSRTIEEALEAGGWEFVRKKKHIVYRRKIQEDESDEMKTQHFTMASTPSDTRSSRNALAHLNRLNADHQMPSDSKKNPMEIGSYCFECNQHLPNDAFSKNQLKKKDKPRCKTCVSSEE